MSSAPAFQFYAQDFLVGTADMTAKEVGGYTRLLCYQWTKGGLPNNMEKLRQLCGIYDDDAAVHTVLEKFRLCEDGKIRNDRMEKGREGLKAFSDKQRDKANARWEKFRQEREAGISRNDTTEMPEDMPRHSQSISRSDALQSSVFSLQSSDSDLQSSSSENKSTGKTSRFVPPSLSEVAAYCKERGNSVNPELWYDHYTSNGWNVGKNKMKDWKAAVRTWEKNNINRTTNAAGNNFGGNAAADRLEDSKRRIAERFSQPSSESAGSGGGVSGEDLHFDSFSDVTTGGSGIPSPDEGSR